jgi:hypothetical protein
LAKLTLVCRRRVGLPTTADEVMLRRRISAEQSGHCDFDDATSGLEPFQTPDSVWNPG